VKSALLAVLIGFIATTAYAEDSIVGKWTYYKKIYQGKEMPEQPGATLRLQFEFHADGTDSLSWHHEGEHDHCYRRGEYKVEGDMLIDKVVWVDPENSPQCASDPDMQDGKSSRTPIHFENGDLFTKIPLGEEEIFFVWKKEA
jgi:hypothetical protein